MSVVIDKLLGKPLLHDHAGEYDLRYLKLTGGTLTGNLLSNAHIGVGGGLSSVNSSYVLEINETFTNTSGERRAFTFYAGSNPSGASSASIVGGVGFAEHTAAHDLSGSLFGMFFGSRNASENTVAVAYGGFSEVQQTEAGTLSYAVGHEGSINDTGGGTVTAGYNFKAPANIGTGGIFTNRYGYFVNNPTGAGTLYNNYGIYMEGQEKGSTYNRAMEIFGTGVNNAIEWYFDTNLYRLAANTLRTDDSVSIGGNLVFGDATTLGGSIQLYGNTSGANTVLSCALAYADAGEYGLLVDRLRLSSGRFDFDESGGKAEMRVSGGSTEFGIFNKSGYFDYMRITSGRQMTTGSLVLDTGTLRLDQTPTAETISPDHTIIININGTDYKFPCVAA